MSKMAGVIKFSCGTYNYQMEWHLTEDNPARYELIIMRGLPDEEQTTIGRVALTGYLLNAYAGNRNLREGLETLVKRAIEAGEIGQE